MGSNVRPISVSIPLFPCVNALPSKNTASLFIYCVRRDLGHGQPRFSSESRLESNLEKLRTGVWCNVGWASTNQQWICCKNALILKRNNYTNKNTRTTRYLNLEWTRLDWPEVSFFTYNFTSIVRLKCTDTPLNVCCSAVIMPLFVLNCLDGDLAFILSLLFCCQFFV